MLRKEGMGFAPWGVIGQGKFMSSSQLAERKASNEPLRGEQSESDVKISEALAKIGEEQGASVTAVALAWAFKKMPYVFPISESGRVLLRGACWSLTLGTHRSRGQKDRAPQG